MIEGSSTVEPFPTAVIEAAATILGVSKDWQHRHLRHYLTQLPADIELYKTRDAIPRPAQVRSQLSRLEAESTRQLIAGPPFDPDRISRCMASGETARGLLLWQFALKVSPSHPERSLEDGRSEEALTAAISDPESMKHAAAAAQASVARNIRAGRGGPRHKADWVLEQVILDLGMLFFELTGKKPGIRTDPYTEQPTGAFVEFLEICLSRLGWDLSRHAIRNHFRKVRQDEGW